ncbi:carbohydrate esterase family 9 protein [Lactarius pseudohatsudake]|nr:carbohydrate esterase family 9 protein [Lactarius pseudohatsudake]
MGEYSQLPMPASVVSTNRPYVRNRFVYGTVLVLLALQSYHALTIGLTMGHTSSVPIHAENTLARCRALDTVPGPSSHFYSRASSDRYVPGTRATLVLDARIWTGGQNGTEIIEGHVYFDKGIFKGVGSLDVNAIKMLHSRNSLDIVDAKGAWVTPGIVDAHSHLGVLAAPSLSGANDGNSHNGPILPWLRSLDGLNTHDESYPLSIAGGVTTALILPGSANAIGGQAFTIKLRKTAERSPYCDASGAPISTERHIPGIRGRSMETNETCMWGESECVGVVDQKGACLISRQVEFIVRHAWIPFGRSAKRECIQSRPSYDGRQGGTRRYDRARQIKKKQDAYCEQAFSGRWSDLGEFPEDLQWEALVDVQTHCYEAVDLDDLIRLSNEFKFSIAAVHHAHEAYLVPDVLKRAYGPPPAAAIFATHARYKREAYRGSEFAPRILAENGIKVVLKSDHPVSNSRFLLFDAQQAHYYGLPENLALGAVTTQPAQVVGLDYRIGYIREGWDADLVIWDSHPLALGATPTQVYIDGIAQIEFPHVVEKSNSLQSVPKVPNFDSEAARAVEYEGLPPLLPNESYIGDVLFKNVKNLFLPGADGDRIRDAFTTQGIHLGVVMVLNGTVACFGPEKSCSLDEFTDSHAPLRTIDLKGGSISPTLVSYGSSLGLSEIQGEISTGDGTVFDPLVAPASSAAEQVLVRAVDGLQFTGRNALLAYRAGVSRAFTAPNHSGFIGGLGVEFSLGAGHKLEKGAVHQDVTALHLSIVHGTMQPSVSTQIAALRQWLFAVPTHGEHGEISARFVDVVQGRIPLVIETHSVDVIATLIELKREFEARTGRPLRLTIAGATEAHLLASELAEAGVGVVLTRARPFPGTWEQRRILPGPPLSKDSAILRLMTHGVTVGVGVDEPSSAAATRFDLGWIALESGGHISKPEAIALASTNLKKLLGGNGATDLVATQGGDLLSFESKVVAVISSVRGTVDLF